MSGTTWFGGHATTGVQVVDEAAATAPSEVELDGRWASGEVAIRVDLDYAPASWSFGPRYRPALPQVPEIAAVQVGQGPGSYVRVGLVNAAYGFEQWDAVGNAMATFSLDWPLDGGPILGLSPGVRLGGAGAASGAEVGGFLGYDPLWRSPTLGPGISWTGAHAGTWSGGYWLPSLDFGQAVLSGGAWVGSAEVLVELAGGRAGAGWLGGGQVVASVGTGGDHEWLGIAVRAEQRYAEPAAVRAVGVEVPRTAVAAAVRTAPVDSLAVALEGKEAWPVAGEPGWTATLLVTVRTGPDPADPFGTE